MSEYDNPEYKKARAALLEGSPYCHWCKRSPATEADHLYEVDKGGSYADGMVPSCKPCNSRRGAMHLNNRRARQQLARNNPTKTSISNNTDRFFDSETTSTPTPIFRISKKEGETEIFGNSALGVGVASDQPRLMTPVGEAESFGSVICEVSERLLNRTLFPWQQIALEGAFQFDDDLVFKHSTALISTARQNGKTTMLSAVVLASLTELPKLWGRPVRILSTAHELGLATEVFEECREVFELWEESGLAKVTWAYGRHKVKMLDSGSEYVVKAATGKKHGGTYDVLICDELWAISEASYFGAFKPSQIAVPSPIAFLTSTAGDETSRAMLRLREQGLASIDKGEETSLFMAEWSLPVGVPLSPEYWGYANPSLGRTITVRALKEASEAPDKSSYLRAHMNQWVTASGAWLAPNVWASCEVEPVEMQGGILAVDSAVDESKYVGIRSINDGGRIVATVAFVADSMGELWENVNRLLENDPKLKLGITPTLDLHTPERWAKRKFTWGYAELLKYTGLVKNMINEGLLFHTGEQMFSEHVNRAVLVRAEGGIVVSSQRSAGNIEMARCLIASAAFVSRPAQTGKATMGFAR